MQTFSKAALTAFLALSSLSINQADAFCARCQKIESDREKEQAEHPKKVGYYDDEIGLATDEDSKTPSPTLPPISKESVNTFSTKSVENVKRPESSSSATQSSLKEKGVNNLPTEGTNGAGTALPKESTFNVSTVQPSKSRNPETYSTIETILLSKDLLTTLGGSFTLFIPADEAFHRLPQGALHDLFRSENKERLSTLVGSYIVPTKIVQKDIKNVQVSTLSGKNLDIRVQNDTLTVDGVKAIHFEPVGENGIIYILDTVLPSSTPAPSKSAQ